MSDACAYLCPGRLLLNARRLYYCWETRIMRLSQGRPGPKACLAARGTVAASGRSSVPMTMVRRCGFGLRVAAGVTLASLRSEDSGLLRPSSITSATAAGSRTGARHRTRETLVIAEQLGQLRSGEETSAESVICSEPASHESVPLERELSSLVGLHL